MADLARRFPANPILRPADVRPSAPGLRVECLLNPGVFRYGNRTGLLLRVAERPAQEAGVVTIPILDAASADGVRLLEFDPGDPNLDATDPRVLLRGDEWYVTTLSHLRLAWSTDGERFAVEDAPALVGDGELEEYGIEDCRVVAVDGRYYLTYTQVSRYGHGVGLITTRDWETYERHGMIVPPLNKDCALFPERIGGSWYMLHRPSVGRQGYNHIWLSRSPDGLHWGDHRVLARTRPGMWDAARIGAGAEPIRTERGWLEIYHGATAEHRYCLGALLLDPDDPSRVLARSREPIMEPTAEYERTGFFGDVVFTNGHVVDGDDLTVYYGASDEVICGARFSVAEILASLG